MDYQTFLKHLPIAKNRLDDELEMQAALFHSIGEEVARLTALRRDARDDYDRAVAAEVQKLKEDEPKISMTAAEQRIKSTKAFRDARRHYTQVCKDLDLWTSLRDSWQQRSYALSTLADLYVNQYYSKDSVTVDGVPASYQEQDVPRTSPRKEGKGRRRRTLPDDDE